MKGLTNANVSSLELMYGVEWRTDIATSACTRIGNMSLHRTLPIQSRMRGCLLDDDGNVVEYLTPNDWEAHILDGSRGQVMVEIPEHYRKFETVGTIRRCKMSEYPLAGFHRVKKMYISAYEATVQRSTHKLCSVKNADADYRGGNNNAAWDGTYRSLLGRPATGINRTNFRACARNRKPTTAEWNCLDYNAYKAVFWLYVVEYANRNSQLAVNAQKDSNGYAQGGLGAGVTTISTSLLESYSAYNPFVPCGQTNKLGNTSGEVAYDMRQADDSIAKTVYANRYRGIENLFGHVWKWCDGVNVQVNPTAGDNTSKVYVSDDPAAYNDNDYVGYAMRGLAPRAEGYIRELIFGDFGDIIPTAVGGGSATFWSDFCYLKIPTATALYGVVTGGASIFSIDAGFSGVGLHLLPSAADLTIGSRLCFIPNN